MRELIIPPLTKEDPDVFEISRFWAAHEEQHVSIHSDLNGDERDFGYLWTDLALHGVHLYAECHGHPAEAVKQRWVEALLQELVDETDQRSGGISG